MECGPYAAQRKGKRGARDQVTEARRCLWRLRLTDLLGLVAGEELMEPAAHMYPSDLERFEASETFAHFPGGHNHVSSGRGLLLQVYIIHNY